MMHPHPHSRHSLILHARAGRGGMCGMSCCALHLHIGMPTTQAKIPPSLDPSEAYIIPYVYLHTRGKTAVANCERASTLCPRCTTAVHAHTAAACLPMPGASTATERGSLKHPLAQQQQRHPREGSSPVCVPSNAPKPAGVAPRAGGPHTCDMPQPSTTLQGLPCRAPMTRQTSSRDQDLHHTGEEYVLFTGSSICPSIHPSMDGCCGHSPFAEGLRAGRLRAPAPAAAAAAVPSGCSC